MTAVRPVFFPLENVISSDNPRSAAKPTPTGSLELWEALADRARAVDEQV